MKKLIILVLVTVSFPLFARDFEAAVLFLTGEVDMENLDQDVMDRYEALERHPVPLNSSSRNRLLSSGLFTPYQAASLADYIASSGDVLSSAELGMIDGFTPELAEALSVFLDFSSSSAPGAVRKRQRLKGSSMARAATRAGEYNLGAKMRMAYGDIAEAGYAARTYYGENQFPPSARSATAAIYGKKHFGKIIIGDYNARFGQGLMLWDGFIMTSVSSLSSFARRPSGLSPSWSYGTMSRRGVAADFIFGRAVTSFMCDLRGKGGGANLTWLMKNGQAGLSAYGGAEGSPFDRGAVSLDGRFCLRGIDYFAEVFAGFAAKEIKAVAGAVIPVSENASLAVRGMYSKTQSSVALGVEAWKWLFTAEFSDKERERQVKMLLNKVVRLSSSLSLKIRLSERLRNYGDRNRSDARVDMCMEKGKFLLNSRLNAVYCTAFSCLGYIEAGYRGSFLTTWLRGGLFRADTWNDRIYVYERDAPGGFNVPAYYGRGFNASLVVGSKIPVGYSKLKAYLRAACTAYPWNKTPKPDRAEFRLQIIYDF